MSPFICLFVAVLLSAASVANSTKLSTTSIAITVDISTVLGTTSSRFAGYNFDWHKNSEEPPLWINDSVQVINFSDPTLNTMMQNLPTRLRIGGSEEDQIVYNVHGTECQAQNTDPAFCFSMQRWSELVSFCDRNHIDLIFGLNAMDRKNSTTPENFTNIYDFLQYTYAHNLNVYGFEFGNELTESAVDATVDGNDYRTLRAMINNIWTSSPSSPSFSAPPKPKLIGNDMNPNPSYLKTLFPILQTDTIDIWTYHNYVGYGLDTNLTQEIMTPHFLNKTYTNIEGILNVYYANYVSSENGRLVDGAPEIYVGETAAAWHSGQENSTNAFVSCFWYSDALARLAGLNHTGFLRQTLIGGAYGLLQRQQPYKPNPDFYVAYLFSQLVNGRMLRVQSFVGTTMNGFLRMYSFCSKYENSKQNSIGVGMLLINIHASNAFDVSLKLSDESNTVNIDALTVWELSAMDSDLNARVMNLNGKPLLMNSTSQLPCVMECGQYVQNDPPNSIVIRPFTVVFIDVGGTQTNSADNVCS